MKRTLLERIQQIDIDPNYCMRMSEIIEIADNSRGICDAICKAFTYGDLKGQRAERKIHERGVINEQQRLFERNPRHAGG